MSLRIYTRTGDDGSTGLFGGRRVSKTDLRIEANGAVDELSAHLAVAATLCSDDAVRKLIFQIQNQLFTLGADLSTPLDDPAQRGSVTIDRVGGEMAASLESTIDELEAGLSPLRTFILPGGSPPAATLHVCRAVCRRAERRVIALGERDATNPEAVRYLNRLSDLLFVLARTANRLAGVEDVPWIRDRGTAAPASVEECSS